jgi:hypothetical protein
MPLLHLRIGRGALTPWGAMAFLNILRSEEEAMICFTFDGWDDDPREVWDIPEVLRFAAYMMPLTADGPDAVQVGEDVASLAPMALDERFWRFQPPGVFGLLEYLTLLFRGHRFIRGGVNEPWSDGFVPMTPEFLDFVSEVAAARE